MPNENELPDDVSTEGTIDTSEHDDKFEDFISKLEAEEERAETERVLAENPDTEEEATEDETKTEVPAGETKPEDKGLERVAAKEKEVRELIAKFETDKKAFEATKANLIDPQMLISQLSLYPEKVLSQLGLDTDTVMKTLLYNKLSDDNPAKAKLRDQLKENDYNRKFADLEAKLAAKETEVKNKEEFQRVTSEAEKYVDELKVKAEKNYPSVSVVAKSESPEARTYLHKRIMKEITDDAFFRYYGKGEAGEPISYDEATQRVEADLAVLTKLLTPPANKTTDKTNTKVVTVPSNSNIKPTPPNKTVKTFSTDEMEEQALQRAITEHAKFNNRGGYRG
jgi:hypothetical protein